MKMLFHDFLDILPGEGIITELSSPRRVVYCFEPGETVLILGEKK